METRTVKLDIDSSASVKKTRREISDIQKDLKKVFDKAYELELDAGDVDDALKDFKKFPDKISSNIDIDLSELEGALKDFKKFPDKILSDIDLDTAELDKAVKEIKDFPTSVSSRVDVDDSALGGVLRKLADLEQTRTAKLKVDDSALNGIGDSIEDEVSEAVENGFSSADISGFAADAGFGIGIGASIRGGIESELSEDILGARLGLNNGQTERLGRISGELYANAYGESLGGIRETTADVFRSLGDDANNLTDVQLSKLVSEVDNLSTVFQVSSQESSDALRGIVTNGLAELENAPDVITRALQIDASGDILDTFREYGSEIQQLGYNAEEFLSISDAGLKAGARNTDLIADLLKEGNINIIEGTKESRNALSALGFDANKVQADLAAGGPAAKKSFGEVLEAISSIEDPVLKNLSYAEIFGTKYEDASVEIIDAMAGAQGSIEGLAGASEDLDSLITDNSATQLEEFKRSFEALTVSLGEAFLPALNAILPVITTLFEGIGAFVGVLDQLGLLTPIVTALGLAFAAKSFLNVASLATNFLSLGSSSGVAGKGITALVTKLVPFGSSLSKLGPIASTLGPKLATGIGGAATKILPKLAGLAASLGPAGLIAIAVAGLAVLIFKNWDKIKEFLGKAFDVIKGLASKFIAAFKKIFIYLLPGGILIKLIINNWNAIKNFFSKVWNSIKAVFSAAGRAIVAGIKLYLNITKAVWSAAFNAIRAVTSTVFNAIRAVISGVMDGIRSVISTGINFVRRLFNFSGLSGNVSAVFNGIKNALISPIQAAWNTIQNLINRIRNGINSVKNLAGSVVGSLNPFAIGGVQTNGIAAYANGGVDRKRAGNGIITKKPTYVTSEYNHTEAILPENASVQRIESILGRTNILGRLQESFASKISNIRGGTTTNNVDSSRTVKIAPNVYINDDGRRSDGERRLSAAQIGAKVADSVYSKTRAAF